MKSKFGGYGMHKHSTPKWECYWIKHIRTKKEKSMCVLSLMVCLLTQKKEF